ncbi:porin [Thauera sp.]|uniref:porin n=1 Tax=Thauera sp. TaxID=1905334 RepID=UPI0033900BC1
MIALAVAGLVSAPAFAQSNVTVYGVADAYVGSFSGDVGGESARVTGVNSGGMSGSRIGFRGAEDLGNGLKAVFTFEQAINLDNANGIEGARQQFVGLAGGFGTVVAGRLQTPGYDWGAKYDPMGAAVFSPMGQLSDARLMTISGREGLARVTNAVAYISPSFSGLVVKAAYSFGEQDGVPGDEERQGVLGLSADYTNGPLAVGVVYHGLSNIAGIDGLDQDEWALGGSYDFGVAKLIATYQQSKVEADGADDYKDKLWSIGASVPVGAAGAAHVSYARAKGDDSGDKATSWALAYTHSLSKRTNLYAGYIQADFDDGAYIESAADLPGVTGDYSFGGVAAEAGEKYRGMVVGIRHTF